MGKSGLLLASVVGSKAALKYDCFRRLCVVFLIVLPCLSPNLKK